MEYFTIEELSRSATARKYGVDNTPSDEHVKRLRALVDNVLDPLRRAYGKPIHVHSGYRSPQVNKLVGGVKNSQHMKGEAADIDGGSVTENRRLFELAIKLDLPFDQLIDERGFEWIHVSYTDGYVRHQILHL